MTGNEVEVAAHRERLLSSAVQEIVKQVRLVQGEAKLPRKVALQVGPEPVAGHGDAVPVWLRDEWSSSWVEVQGEARQRGIEDPVLHVYLPKKSADRLREYVVGAEAARRVLERRGTPASAEGQEARESMKSRLGRVEASRDDIVRQIVRSAKVLQGGALRYTETIS